MYALKIKYDFLTSLKWLVSIDKFCSDTGTDYFAVDISTADKISGGEYHHFSISILYV